MIISKLAYFDYTSIWVVPRIVSNIRPEREDFSFGIFYFKVLFFKNKVIFFYPASMQEERGRNGKYYIG